MYSCTRVSDQVQPVMLAMVVLWLWEITPYRRTCTLYIYLSLSRYIQSRDIIVYTLVLQPKTIDNRQYKQF